MADGHVVILNGPPRAGKTTIARALQRSPDAVWLNLGVDAFRQATPEHLHPGIGLRPGGERPDLEPAVAALYGALFAAIAAAARSGVNVVADLGIHADYSGKLRILPGAVERLRGLPVLFVGVTAPLDQIMARRNADPQGGLYETGSEVPGPVQRWHEAVHHHGLYDLLIDTGQASPEAAVREIEKALAKPPAPSAFERLDARG